MELDPRIKKDFIIFSPFAVNYAKNEVKKYINTKCYFCNDIIAYEGLENCDVGILAGFNYSDYHPYIPIGNTEGYKFCLPATFVEEEEKPKEKKLRPYTLMEFCDKFPVGLPIKYRRKGNEGWERYLILNGYRHEHEQRNDRTITYIYIGNNPFTLDELFNEYEWQEHYTEDFKPFGVEIEE